MAENNHAEVKGSVLGQSFTIGTKDVISLLLIVMICLAGWFAWQSNEKRLDNFQAQHVLFGKMMLEQKELMAAQIVAIRKMLLIHEHNQGLPPEERLPLELDVPPPPKSPSP